MADDLFADVPDAGGGLFDDIPDLKGTPGVRAALKDILNSEAVMANHRKSKGQPARDKGAELAERYLGSFSLGAFDKATQGLGAGVTALQRAIPGGKEPTYTPSEYAQAMALYRNARQRRLAGENPVTSFAADLAGGLMMPGGALINKFVVGKTVPKLANAGKKVPLGARTAQGLRASGAAGVQGGTQGALQANPGEEGSEALRGGATAAVLAPVIGGAAEAVRTVAPVVSRTSRRAAAPVTTPLINLTKPGSTSRALLEKYVAPPTPEVESLRKIAKVLQKQQLDPAAVEAALAEWKKAGGVTPAMIDILRDAGASQPVLTFLNESGATAPVRVAAEKQAAETVQGMQGRVLAETEKLQTGDPRTPSAVRADTTARTAAVDEGLAAEQAAIEEARLAGVKAPPPAPVSPEKGAEAFSNDLNAKYDASYKTYKEKFDAVENLDPETARVADDESDRIYKALLDPIKNRSDRATKEVRSYLKEFWPEDGKLTVLQLRHMEEDLNGIIQGSMDKRNADVAVSVKKALDNETNRLFTEGKIEGDPNVITLWADAKNAFIEHQKNFGKGLAKTLTERDPYQPDVRKVEPWRAAEVIFGPKGAKPVNTLFSDLTDALRIASPEATEALKGELYLRLADMPDELARLLKESTGGRELLPKPLTELNIATQAENVAGDEAAAAATAAAEEAAMAAKASIAAEENALGLGEQWFAKSRDKFSSEARALPDELQPLVGVGAKGQLIADVEKGTDASIANNLRSPRATENLSEALGPEPVAQWQAALGNIEKNAQNANEVAAAVSGAPELSPFLANPRAGDLVYPKVGATFEILNLLKKAGHLSPEEQMALLKRLSDPAESGLDELKASLIRKYPSKSVAATPAVAKAFSAPGGDADALQLLREEYGVVD